MRERVDAMICERLKTLAGIAIVAGAGIHAAHARDGISITLPRHSELTLVQRLNRQGVVEVKKHHYDKAEALFYRAYIYDPADPFSLNNLGYIAEMRGQLNRALEYYRLASEQGCDADIELSNVVHLEGQPMNSVFESLKGNPLLANRLNLDALQLLSEDRSSEAAALLERALSSEPQNPFTLNNLGVAHEKAGDYQAALKYYVAAADLHSSESVVLALDNSWRGRPVSEMAAASARQLKKKMQGIDDAEAHAAMFSMQGVFAANRNDWATAKQDFLDAYSLDPGSAFSLNNRGYVAEMEGDLETAQFFYDKARKAEDSAARIGLATQLAAEGKPLINAASDSTYKVDSALVSYSQNRRKQTGPIELTPRSNNLSGNSTGSPNQGPAPSLPPPSSTPQAPR